MIIWYRAQNLICLEYGQLSLNDAMGSWQEAFCLKLGPSTWQVPLWINFILSIEPLIAGYHWFWIISEDPSFQASGCQKRQRTFAWCRPFSGWKHEHAPWSAPATKHIQFEGCACDKTWTSKPQTFDMQPFPSYWEHTSFLVCVGCHGGQWCGRGNPYHGSSNPCYLALYNHNV